MDIKSLYDKFLHDFPANSILDVGPGYGDFALQTARLTGAREIAFMDCNGEVLDFQQKKCTGAGISCVLYESVISPEYINAMARRFDLILCQEVLEHLHDAEGILRALTGRLSARGAIIITVPTARSEQWLRRIDSSYMEGIAHGHVRQFTGVQLADMAKDAGLSVKTLNAFHAEYFLAHTWMALSRMRIDGATGRILTGGIRLAIFRFILAAGSRTFSTIGPSFWDNLMPRNYFLMAIKEDSSAPAR